MRTRSGVAEKAGQRYVFMTCGLRAEVAEWVVRRVFGSAVEFREHRGGGNRAVDETVPRELAYRGNETVFRKAFPRVPGKVRRRLRLSTVAAYSITRPTRAAWVSRTIRELLGEARRIVLTDATANVGGNTASFATHFEEVHAVELVPLHCDMLRNNLGVLEPVAASRVSVHCGDFLDHMGALRQHVVFMDPPWGGPGYATRTSLSLSLGGKDVAEVVDELLGSRASPSQRAGQRAGQEAGQEAGQRAGQTRHVAEEVQRILAMAEGSTSLQEAGQWARQRAGQTRHVAAKVQRILAMAEDSTSLRQGLDLSRSRSADVKKTVQTILTRAGSSDGGGRDGGVETETEMVVVSVPGNFDFTTFFRRLAHRKVVVRSYAYDVGRGRKQGRRGRRKVDYVVFVRQ